MTWTVRIYTAEDKSTHNDTTYADRDSAFGYVYTDPLPLPDRAPQAVETLYGFDIYDDTGVCIHSIEDGANVGKPL